MWDFEEFFSLDPLVGRGHALHEISRFDLDSESLCFLGDYAQALKAISVALHVSGLAVNPEVLNFTYLSDDCVRSHPYWEGDVCDEWKTVTYVRSVKRCSR